MSDGTDTPNVPPAGIHEIGVGGSVLAQTRSFVEEYIHPEIVQIVEPDTGLEVHAIVGKDGVEALPASLFDEYRATPKRRTGTATLFALASFIEHVNRFKDADSAIFGNNDRKRPSLLAVLDYNKIGSTSDARFGDHRSAFLFPLSDEWKAWQASNGKQMDMVEFAIFLEDRIIDVMPTSMVSLNDKSQIFVDTLGGVGKIADPATLMQISTELRIMETSHVSKAQNLSSGEAKIDFANEHDASVAGQSITIPSLFVIGIPVFNNGDPYQIIARFRYRKSGSQVKFWYDLWRTDKVFDHAFDEALTDVAEKTSLPVLLGTPEGSPAVSTEARF